MLKGGDVLFNRVGKVNSVKSNFYGEIIRAFFVFNRFEQNQNHVSSLDQ